MSDPFDINCDTINCDDVMYRRDSFDHVKQWFDRAKQLGGEHLEALLVGNKIDLPQHQRQVSSAEGDALAIDLGIPFIETRYCYTILYCMYAL